MSAQILSLARTSHDGSRLAEAEDNQTSERLEDGDRRALAPSRGIALGMLISVPVWLALGVLVYLVL